MNLPAKLIVRDTVNLITLSLIRTNDFGGNAVYMAIYTDESNRLDGELFKVSDVKKLIDNKTWRKY